MNSNAPGQFLGYTIQLPRALYHLLKIGPGEAVCIEVLGDIAVKLLNNKVIAEEDKSSLNSKPITDKSTDLWKTFYNWIQSIHNGDIDAEKTQYLLYCNQSGRKSIVDQFSEANNISDAELALQSAKDKLKDIKSDHSIWKYYDFVVNENESILLQIICNFEIRYGIGASYDEIDFEIRSKLIPETQVEFLRNSISGWLLKTVQDKIVKKEPAHITFEDFNQQFVVLFERVRKRELIDFALESLPNKEAIHSEVKIRPCYIQQLDLIDSSDDDIVDAVSSYLRADVNLIKWIENDIIDEDIANDFNNNLKGFWTSQQKTIELTEKKLSSEEKGVLLLESCKSRQETINGNHPPYPTIAGAYHILADEPTLGWHPSWEELLKKEGD